jgi:WD40 repeat protein
MHRGPKTLTALAILIAVLLAAPCQAQEEYFGKNKVQWKDFDWEFLQTPHFDIYFYQDSYKLAKFSAAVLESALVVISDQLNYRIKKRVPVFIYKSPNDFQQTNITNQLLGEGTGGFTEVFKNRMVMPYNGSYEDFRHVLHHELTHAVTFDMLYGGAIGSVLTSRSLFQMPLWLSEGFAEYSSRNGWDYWADMVMRDAIISGYAPNVEYLGGYLAYKEGQLAIKYIVDTYGIEKVGELFKKGKVYLAMDKAMKRSIGLNQKEFSENFLKYCRKLYWPEIARRSEAKEIARQLTDHTKDGSYFNERPAFSPAGDRLAIFTDKTDYTEIVVISTVDGELLSRVVKGSRSADLESLHSYVSGLSWSPDGENLAFMSQSKGEDALRLANVRKKKVYKRYKFGFNAMLSPSWGGENGNSIVFTGVRDGQSDLYMLDLTTEKLKQLTNDFYEDQEPSISPNGKLLVFASDRPSADASDPSDIMNLEYGTYNLYTYSLETGEIQAITSGYDSKRYPTWSPDGSKICFVGSYNGIDNLYIVDTNDLCPFPITDILTNTAAPSWSPKGDAIAFSSFNRAGFDIFLLKNIKPIANGPDSLEKTVFAAGTMDELLTKPAVDLDEVTDTSKTVDRKSEEAGSGDNGFEDFVFRSGDGSEMFADEDDADTSGMAPQGIADSLYSKREDGEYDTKPYKAKFSPDLVTGGLSYDTFFGLRGQSFLVISDYLGNHQFFLATDLVNAIDQTNFQFFYLNSSHRIDWGLGIFHMKNYFIDPIDRLFSDRVYGLASTVAYPFSKFSRLELSLSHMFIDRKYYDPPYDDSDNKITTSELSWVTDNILWGITGPVNGKRYKVTVERTLNIYTKSIDYWAVQFDFRKYYHFAKQYGIAFRAAGGVSGGNNPKNYYLGGTSNWIGSAEPGLDVYGVENLYFSKVVTPLRGYNYYEVQGSKFAITNFEFRFPFVEYFAVRFPLPIVLSRMRGAIFLDVGAAWDENELFKGATTDGPFRLVSIKSGFGYGARVNLGFVVMKFDQAWKTDLNQVSEPKYYFSLGAEF